MTIMYRCPGELRHVTRGFLYDQQEFEDAEAARAAGWADSLDEAAGLVAPAEPEKPAAPTREELEAEATALGVKFDGRLSDKTLAERIAAAKG